jgi:hypothetical protein
MANMMGVDHRHLRKGTGIPRGFCQLTIDSGVEERRKSTSNIKDIAT